MSEYAFAKEIGLVLRQSYPVVRDGKRVSVPTSELDHDELDEIHQACLALDLAIGKLRIAALDRLEKMSWEMLTPEDREEEFRNPALHYRIRGDGWRTWEQLTPKQQAKVRADRERKMANITLTPREHAEAIQVRAKRLAMQKSQQSRASHP